MILPVTNPNKILFPQDKIKKIDVINYYLDVCNFMLPFIKNRPLTVIRCHQSIEKEIFIKKHPTDSENVNIFKEKDEKYFFIKDTFQLVSQVQNGTIEFHVNGGIVKKIQI